MADPGDNGRASKRPKIREMIGSKGLIEKTEYTKIIIDALNSLGYAEVETHLQQKSEVVLRDADVEKFLDQAKKGEWDESIATLQGLGLGLNDENFMKFLLLEQKVLDCGKMSQNDEALAILRNQIKPLGVNMKRLTALLYKIGIEIDKHNTVISRSEVLKKLESLLPPGLIIPKSTLENLLETTLSNQLQSCPLHNIPDSKLELSLCSYHNCWSD